jgi:hypothetical protein
MIIINMPTIIVRLVFSIDRGMRFFKAVRVHSALIVYDKYNSTVLYNKSKRPTVNCRPNENPLLVSGFLGCSSK